MQPAVSPGAHQPRFCIGLDDLRHGNEGKRLRQRGEVTDEHGRPSPSPSPPKAVNAHQRRNEFKAVTLPYLEFRQ